MITAPHDQVRPIETEAAFCADYRFELQQASDYGWLVRAATSAHDGTVLGCIDQLDEGVELMRLDGGFTWTTFASLHDALENLAIEPPATGSLTDRVPELVNS